KYSSQRPHELLGQFVKERLSRCSIKVAYSTSSRRLVNRLIKEFSNSFSLILSNSCPSQITRLSGVSLEGDAHSTDAQESVNGHFEINSK
ncbi:hypothetical protein, partial [Marinobacter salexigens]|uniref:hypothetical protein n=1 Tax=Marinobacter salexigens TaxID=1925763 RepID=UPI001961B2A3